MTDQRVYCPLCLGIVNGGLEWFVTRLATGESAPGKVALHSRCPLCYSMMGEWGSVVSLVTLYEPNDLLTKSRVAHLAYELDEKFSGGAPRVQRVSLDDFWTNPEFVDIRRRAMLHLVMMLREVLLHHPEHREKVNWVITYIGSIIE